MGKGIGAVKFYIANVKRGIILLELQAFISKSLLYLLKKMNSKLSIKTCVMLRAYY